MLFNSLEFALFLPIVFIIYWFVLNKSTKAQNLFLLIVSYIFYGWWDWRFLSLIFISTIVDYSVAYFLGRTESKQRRRLLLVISIVMNLGFLGFFKYYNFFLDSFVDAFSIFGLNINHSSLKIILPVGISFYTFQTMSYTIDVYKKKLEASNDIIAFFAYVSFFPQLVAGPIERATNLLPQFFKIRNFSFEMGKDGLRQILWGLVKKMVIADNCATATNYIFSNHQNLPGSMLVLGAVFFAFQIYGDFSGYSDIAVGTAKLFGFNLMTNFRMPYFSRDIAEFWRRWHISLSTWFRDYVYIPLGGSKGTTYSKIRNVFIVFLVSGFWHGANLTFLVWGGLNAIYFLPLLLREKNRKNLDEVADGKIFPSIMEFSQILFTFFLVCIGWVFFRADNVKQAYYYISGIFSRSLFEIPFINIERLEVIIILIVLIIIEWLNRSKTHVLQDLKFNRLGRWSIYLTLSLLIIINSQNTDTFIYFQF